MRKRRMGAAASEPAAMASTGSDTSETKMGARATVADIPKLTQILNHPSSTPEEIVEATRGFRRILSVERNPPVETVLQAGVLPILVRNLVANAEASTLIFESAWALTNIASTSETRAVVDAGAAGPLIQLLRHTNADVREQAVWCLGNIAGDNAEFRDTLLHHGIAEPLILNIQQPANMSLLNNATWTVSNLCRGKPASDINFVAPFIGPLCHLLHTEVSLDVLVDAVWALSYLSDGPNERIELVMQTGVTQKLVSFLSDKSSTLLTPTIRCLGNFVTGSDIQTDAVIDAGILDHICELLENPRKTIRKETCWLASNIAAGTHEQITSLMRRNDIMRKLIETGSNASWETKKEALWAVSNICTTGNDEHVRCLVEIEGMKPLTEVLNFTNADATILTAALDAIARILDVGERNHEEYAKMFDEYAGIDHLENLQEHPSTQVYEKTVSIIESYFGADEAEDENLAPETTASGTFGFGISSPKQLFSGMDNGMDAQPVYQFGDANRAF